MHPLIIIHDKMRIESRDEKIINVPLPEANGTDNWRETGQRAYKLQCGREAYEIHCPEVQTENGRVLIVPTLIIPGMRYPVYVYIYAVTVYSANPEMGQREAAKLTKEYFGLETFSHTTLGRAMKKVEALIADGAEGTGSESATQQREARRFPSVEEMQERKKAVLSYIKEAAGKEGLALPEPKPPQPRPPYTGAFIDACHRISAYAYKKHGRLLL